MCKALNISHVMCAFRDDMCIVIAIAATIKRDISSPIHQHTHTHTRSNRKHLDWIWSDISVFSISKASGISVCECVHDILCVSQYQCVMIFGVSGSEVR